LNQTAIDVGIDCSDVFKPFLEPARYKVAEGGRGGGKSHFFAEMGVLEVLMHGKLFLCCREVQKSIKHSVKALLVNKIKKMGLMDRFTILDQEIRCNHNEGAIYFAGLRQSGGTSSSAENLKSYEGVDICWVEEAQTISKFSLDILLPTIRKPGSEIWFSYNRKKEKECVHAKFVEAENIPEGTVHVYVNYWDNPWFPEDLRSLMESDKLNSIDDYNHIWCGKPQTRSKATIFTRWRIADCTPGPDDKLYHAIDFGFFPDPCCALRCWLNYDLKRIYIDHAYFTVRLDPEDIGHKLLAKIDTTKHAKIFGDSARPEIISSLKKKKNGGYKMEGVKKGPGSVDFGINWLQAWDIWIHPRCKEICDPEYDDYNLIKEFEQYKYKVDPLTGQVLPVIIDDMNHGIDTLRYALSELILSTKKLDYKALAAASPQKTRFEQQRQVAEIQKNAGLLIPPTDTYSASSLEKKKGVIYLKAKDLGINLSSKQQGIYV